MINSFRQFCALDGSSQRVWSVRAPRRVGRCCPSCDRTHQSPAHSTPRGVTLVDVPRSLGGSVTAADLSCDGAARRSVPITWSVPEIGRPGVEGADTIGAERCRLMYQRTLLRRQLRLPGPPPPRERPERERRGPRLPAVSPDREGAHFRSPASALMRKG